MFLAPIRLIDAAVKRHLVRSLNNFKTVSSVQSHWLKQTRTKDYFNANMHGGGSIRHSMTGFWFSV